MWILGPELSYGSVWKFWISGGIYNSMFTSPNGGGVIIAGDYRNGVQENSDYSTDIIELRAGAKN